MSFNPSDQAIATGNASKAGQPSEAIGLIGTGLFGTALGERLLADGFPVVVFNRTREKAVRLIEKGARWSENPLAECRRVVFSVYTTQQVGELIKQMQTGLSHARIILDTSTSDPKDTAALGARLAEQGVHYLESPFSGSSEQLRNHQATAIVAGDRSVFDACKDLWDCLAARTFFVSAWGNAAKMKLVTNLVLGLNRAALAEGLVFAESTGLSPRDALEVLLNSPAYSRIMDAKGPKMIEREFTPEARLAQHIKDVRLILAEVARGGATLPFSTVHLRLLEQAEAAGLGELDNSAILRIIEDAKLRGDALRQ